MSPRHIHGARGVSDHSTGVFLLDERVLMALGILASGCGSELKAEHSDSQGL